MDILKTATEWTKAEVFSSAFFILFGIAFLLASFGFWQSGKTDVARAYVFPLLIAGALLLIIGLGIFIPSQNRLSSFPAAFASDAPAFVTSEIARADKVLNQYRIAVFHVIPLIIAVCAVLIPFLDGPLWRAGLVTTIAMMAAIMLIDTNANARLQDYKAALSQAEPP